MKPKLNTIIICFVILLAAVLSGCGSNCYITRDKCGGIYE